MTTWSKFAADFNAMTNKQIEAECARARSLIDEQEEWLEAVAAWQKAGKPRKAIGKEAEPEVLSSAQLHACRVKGTALMLTTKGQLAMRWLYGPYKGKPQERSYRSLLCGDPGHAAFNQLIEKGLVVKIGGNGFPISYKPTPFGLEVRKFLIDKEKEQ